MRRHGEDSLYLPTAGLNNSRTCISIGADKMRNLDRHLVNLVTLSLSSFSCLLMSWNKVRLLSFSSSSQFMLM